MSATASTFGTRNPRGFSLFEGLAIAAAFGLLVMLALGWYQGRDCQTLEGEPRRMLTRISELQAEKKKTQGAYAAMSDCFFARQGALGDCASVGLTSNFPTRFAYHVDLTPTGYRAIAIGQSKETAGSLLVLTEDGEIDDSASVCR
jgi:hypothetical protein